MASSEPLGAATPAVLPFSPQLLEERLQKVGKDLERPVPIENSIEGLRAYLSALNIRNKCKHPLFLVLRFHTCLGLLYDSATVSSPAEHDGTFYQMMKAMATGGATGQRSPPAAATGSMGPRFAPFVIAVKGDHSPNCNRVDCPIRLSSVLSLPHASVLPPEYKMLCDRQVAELRKTYCRLYCSHNAGTFVDATPPLCGTCKVAHHVPPPIPSADAAAAQRHAGKLLASVRQMTASDIAGTGGGGADGGGGGSEDYCPEQEWQHGLHILAEALATHCRTRTPAEIVQFMRDDVQSSKRLALTNSNTDTKAPAPEAQALPLVAYDHSHANPTTTCDMGPSGADWMQGIAGGSADWRDPMVGGPTNTDASSSAVVHSHQHDSTHQSQRVQGPSGDVDIEGWMHSDWPKW